MAILTSRSSRRREWLAQTRLRARFEKRLAARLRGEFKRTANDAARGFDGGGEMGAMLAVNGHRERVAAILGRGYRGIMLAVNERLSGELRSIGLVDETKLHPDASEFLRRTDAWIALIGGQKIKRITDTTFSQIVNALREGVAEGEGSAAVAKRIRDVGSGVGRVRAEVIARTELHSASMQAQRETIDMQPEGVREQMRQEWVAAEDERTRPAHRAADGQIVELDERFDVGGEALQYPGDPAGSAGNIINCRCVSAPVIDD